MSSREKFEQAIKARFGDLIDYRVCKNSDGEYMAWDMQWWKPGSPRRNLVKSGALILAEIERIDRAAGIGVKGE